jgi:hypothetical protein
VNLVLQGPGAGAAQAAEAARLAGARDVQQIADTAFRLRGAE